MTERQDGITSLVRKRTKKKMIEPRNIRAYQSHLLNLKFNFQEANNEIRYFRRYHKEDPESHWTKTSRQTLQGRLDMIELFLGGLERWNEARGRRDPLVEDARADFEKLRAEVDEIEKSLKRPAPIPTAKVGGDSFCPIILLAIATITALSIFFTMRPEVLHRERPTGAVTKTNRAASADWEPSLSERESWRR